jgi:hypothetical protein
MIFQSIFYSNLLMNEKHKKNDVTLPLNFLRTNVAIILVSFSCEHHLNQELASRTSRTAATASHSSSSSLHLKK